MNLNQELLKLGYGRCKSYYINPNVQIIISKRYLDYLKSNAGEEYFIKHLKQEHPYEPIGCFKSPGYRGWKFYTRTDPKTKIQWDIVLDDMMGDE